MKTYETMVEALVDLRRRGYEFEFIKETSRLYCQRLSLALEADKFSVDEYHRFEENSSPDDTSVIYAISSIQGVKGVIVDGYGIYAETISFDLAKKL